MQRLRSVEAARAEVRPVVGEVVACDSAEAVYGHALRALGEDVSALPPAAMAPLFRALRGRGARPRVAMDARAVADREARFPHAGRLGTR